jgi:hypothetical protein
MSSTTGIQNLLVNVFRPVYQYDTTTSLFTPKLGLSNIDTYSGNIVQAIRADFGDTAGNMYVGSNAGNSIASIRDCLNATAVGQYAGNAISNVSNVTYLGYNTGVNAQGSLATPVNDVIGIGVSAGGAGVSNIFIGNGTASTGSNNILIGHGIAGGASNNLFRVGSTVYGNLSTNWIGIGTSTPYEPVNNRLDVNGNTYLFGQLGINITPGSRTLDVNGDFRAQDASGNILDFGSGKLQSSAGFFSSQGSMPAGVNSTVIIGTLKRGIVIVTAIDQATSANRATETVFAYTTSNTTSLSSSSNGDLSISYSSSNIQLSNASGSTAATYNYSITYFPVA